MKTVWADFNTGTDDDHVSLMTQGSQASMMEQSCYVGERVIISDDGVRAEAVIVVHDRKIQARVDWATQEDI